MKACNICEGRAHWQRKKGKKYEDLEEYLCDPCLMEGEAPGEMIDSYKYIGDDNQ